MQYFPLFVLPKRDREEFGVLVRFLNEVAAITHSEHPDKVAFKEFVAEYHKAQAGLSVSNPLITEFIELERRAGLKTEWVERFFASKKADLEGFQAQTVEETLGYLEDTAESIALLFSQMFHYPDKARMSVVKIMRGITYIRKIRDMKKNLASGRQYIPDSVLRRFKLKDLQFPESKRQQAVLMKLLRQEIDRAQAWMEEADAGLAALPRSQKVFVKIERDIFFALAKSLHNQPLVVYKGPLKLPFYVRWKIVITNLILG